MGWFHRQPLAAARSQPPTRKGAARPEFAANGVARGLVPRLHVHVGDPWRTPPLPNPPPPGGRENTGSDPLSEAHRAAVAGFGAIAGHVVDQVHLQAIA